MRTLLAAAVCAAPVLGWAAPLKQIAISIDDVPVASTVPVSLPEMREINQALLRSLRQHQVPAIGFVNEDKLYRRGEVDARIDLLRAWLDAGMELGNHNFGHLGLWASSLAEVQDAVVKGEVITRSLTQERQAPLRFYRPPYTQTGRDDAQQQAFEAFLAERGYQVAPFTIEHDDHLFACVYEHLSSTADRQRVVDDYLRHLATAVRTFETMSQELWGRQIPQILLIHANRLNADSLDATLRALQSYGYAFVSMEQALQDPAYRASAHASGRFGPSWLARWARAAGSKLSVYGQPDPMGWIAEQAQALCGDGAEAAH